MVFFFSFCQFEFVCMLCVTKVYYTPNEYTVPTKFCEFLFQTYISIHKTAFKFKKKKTPSEIKTHKNPNPFVEDPGPLEKVPLLSFYNRDVRLTVIAVLYT